MSLQRLTKTVLTLAVALADLRQDFADYIETPWAATTEARKEVERQKKSVAAPKNSASAALSYVAGSRERVAVSNKRWGRLLGSASEASAEIERAGAALRHAWATIW